MKKSLAILSAIATLALSLGYAVFHPAGVPRELAVKVQTITDRLFGDFTKANQKFGWKPEIPFKQTLINMLDYWRLKVSRPRI